MLSWIKKHKIISSAVFLAAGILIGLGIAVQSNIVSKTDASVDKSVVESVQAAGSTGGALAIQDAFIRVADTVGPAVVSIATETTQKIAARRYSFGPPRGHFDDRLNDFFKDFFGEIPEREFKRRGLGSGVIIDKEGYIITNDHVIGEADKITVILPDGRQFEAEIKGRDSRSDLAVIKINGKDLPAAELGDSDSVRTGQWAVAIGNPFGYVVNNPKPTVTVGVVSAVHRSLPLGNSQGRNYIDLIQTDAAINPGNSGGPLCDLEGKIIGLNVAIYSTTGGSQGVGFAIPARTVKWVLGDLVEGKKVLYGWFGVTVQELTYDMAEYFNIEDKKGVIVIETVEGGPADKAGIKSGDIIRAFNGKKVDSLQSLLKLVGESEVNKEAKVGLIRDGKDLALTVVVGERPSEEALAKGKKTKGAEAGMPEGEKKWRGLRVVDITDEIEERYGIRRQSGVLVLAVDSDSPAYDAGIRKGLIIKAIDQIIIRNMEDYNKAVAGVKGNALVRTNRGYAIVKEGK